jgi:site-specific DNA-methyltransferase (adenine-specific)
MGDKKRAPRNRTILLTPADRIKFGPNLVHLSGPVELAGIRDRVIHQDLMRLLDYLPVGFVDLLFLDPPYNLSKSFQTTRFPARSAREYARWFESWLVPLLKVLKPTASIYCCGDWRCSAALQGVLEKHLIIRNRITWEREKGRGALANWKNCSEDVWFATVSKHYRFNAAAVKLRRKVIAPYTHRDGRPKDWQRTARGNERATFPSNLWTDLTVPFWSMPENTDHPTQKPEKLLAKIILASTNPGDMVLDPFCGSGTALVAARKLDRHYTGVEIEKEYCLLAEKRLALAASDKTIQGYADGVFWERNSMSHESRVTSTD